MIFKLVATERAVIDLAKLKRSEPASHKKAMTLIRELESHPTTGTGHPKPMGADRAGQWSRHISHKHRLVYEIKDEVVTVLVISAYGHYDDK